MDEPHQEFAERAQKLAYQGFLEVPIPMVETVAVDSFLKGFTYKQATLTTVNQAPASIQAAVQVVISAIHNQSVLLADKAPKSRVRLLSFEDEEAEPTVRQVSGREAKVQADVTSAWVTAIIEL
mgnify:CR=1 FL=1